MTHEELVARAVRYLRSQRCRVVVWQRNINTDEQPDALGWRTHGQSLLVECKASRADFFRDAKKVFRVHPALGMGGLRYFLTDRGLVEAGEVPVGWGLLEVRGRSVVQVVHAKLHVERSRANEIKQLVRAASGYADRKCEDPFAADGSHI